MEHHAEDMRRAAKAYNLCLAFEALCKKRKPRMKKSEMLKHAYAMDAGFWYTLAAEAGLRHPSDATISTAIGILAARAKVDV